MAIITVGVILVGCAHAQVAGGTSRSPSVLRVVAVEAVYGDLVGQLGGSAVHVTTILNSASADPHSYDPGAQDADAIAAADIVIENGLGYDAFVDKLLAASPHTGRVVLNVGALAGHHLGDNPHIWYEVATLQRMTDAMTSALNASTTSDHPELARRHRHIADWISTLSARLATLKRHHAGTAVAITEPVFDYVLNAGRLRIATPKSFSHAIEEGSDPAPQDFDIMRDLIVHRRVAAFVYNGQTIEPATAHLLDAARSARVSVVMVTETLPAHKTTQEWFDDELSALEHAL